MKFLFGPIDDDNNDEENVLCVRIISLVHSSSSSFTSTFSSIIGCYLYCVADVRCPLTRRKIEKKVLKSRICHFSSTSLHFICTLASSTRPSVGVTRVRVFLIRTHSPYNGGGCNTHSTHGLWPERIMSERRDIISLLFSSFCFDRFADSVFLFFSTSWWLLLTWCRACVLIDNTMRVFRVIKQ